MGKKKRKKKKQKKISSSKAAGVEKERENDSAGRGKKEKLFINSQLPEIGGKLLHSRRERMWMFSSSSL